MRSLTFALCLIGGLFFLPEASAQIKSVTRSSGLARPAGELEPVLDPHPAPLAKPVLLNRFSGASLELTPPSAYHIREWDVQGLPVWVDCLGLALNQSTPESQAWKILNDLSSRMGIREPFKEWVLDAERVDGDGFITLSFHQEWEGIPVDGSECRLNGRDGHLSVLTGRYVATPSGGYPEVTIGESEAIRVADDLIGGGVGPAIPASWLPNLSPPRVVLWPHDGTLTRVWRLERMAGGMHHWTIYVDAASGEVVHQREETCSLAGHLSGSPLDGPFSANATDLKGISRSINTYQVGSTFYMLDGSRPMFKASSSKLPDDPVGGILTIDALNTSPALNSFKATHVTSPGNSWNHPAAVSAHYNAGVAYEYYRQTFNRNSINGSGGSILSFVNVADDDGGPMDNAYWNGAAMFYGNGDQAFLPLARALDVGGHEMTHGVIQSTANLTYERESGALNESFADVFATMIDRDDWKIGEEVVKTSVFPSGALRDLANPHNGGSGLGSPGWQPSHTNEMYTGSQDNGGVHINSGIPNHAFYLFASNGGVTKEQAEQVYYHALDKYLVKSSQFIDLRNAVIQSCKDLFGSGTPLVTIAENAFNAVGIGSGNSGGDTPDDYQDDIEVNPGDDFLLFTDADKTKLYISLPDGSSIQVLSNTQPISRPSVTDDGTLILFIGADKKMHLISINWVTGTPTESIIQNQPIWANVAIAKDGSRLAAVPDDILPVIQVFDFGKQAWADYDLYNPTFAEGVVTGEVRYADALEFDNSGEYVTYDAYNLITNQSGNDFDYWDIGFLNVWDTDTDEFASGNIFKLFASLPDQSSVGNPTFAKNSSYILAFDFYDGQADQFYMLGGNLESGDVGTIYANTVLGYPCYSVTDQQLIFNAEAGFFQDPVLARIDLASNKIEGDEASAVVLVDGGQKGVWFANGNRPLTGTQAPLNPEVLLVTPNPGQGSFRISGTDENGQVRVLDARGATVRQWTSVNPGETLDLTGCPAGMYVVEWTGDHRMVRTLWMNAK